MNFEANFINISLICYVDIVISSIKNNDQRSLFQIMTIGHFSGSLTLLIYLTLLNN